MRRVNTAPMASRVRYAGCVGRTAEANGWSWAWWQFDSDFSLYDIERDVWVEPILHALIPPQPCTVAGALRRAPNRESLIPVSLGMESPRALKS